MSLWKMLKRRPELCLMVRPACTRLRAAGQALPSAHAQHTRMHARTHTHTRARTLADDMAGETMQAPLLHIMLFCLRELHAQCSDASHVCGVVYQRIEFRHSGARLRVRKKCGAWNVQTAITWTRPTVFLACPLFCSLINPWMNVQNWTAAISPSGLSSSHFL